MIDRHLLTDQHPLIAQNSPRQTTVRMDYKFDFQLPRDPATVVLAYSVFGRNIASKLMIFVLDLTHNFLLHTYTNKLSVTFFVLNSKYWCHILIID